MSIKLSQKETEAWVGLVLSSEKLLAKVESELKNKGLPPYSWYDVLLELDKSQAGKLRFVDLGKRVLLSRYNVSRIIKRLEQKGLVTTRSSKDDERGKYALITKKGRDTRRRMWPIYYKVIKEYFLSNFNKNELDDFIQHIRKIRNTLELKSK